METEIISKKTINDLEKGLINLINREIDDNKLSDFIREKYNINGIIKPNGGEIVSHNNEMAYKINCDIEMLFSVLFDENGKCNKIFLQKNN